MLPEVTGARRITDNAVVVLPEPDSPTIAMVRPLATSNDTPSTACTTAGCLPQPPARTLKCTFKSRTDNKGAEETLFVIPAPDTASKLLSGLGPSGMKGGSFAGICP